MNKYWLARIDFLDHADCPSQQSGIIPITVWGLIIYEDKIQIHLLKWAANHQVSEHNSETWAIVKHPGIKIEKIREESV